MRNECGLVALLWFSFSLKRSIPRRLHSLLLQRLHRRHFRSLRHNNLRNLRRYVLHWRCFRRFQTTN